MAQYFNSNCSTISVGCYLYNGPGLTNPVANGFYSDGTNCYTVSGGNGYVSNVTTCSSSTNVTINWYVPYILTCGQDYTFAAATNYVLDTSLEIDIYWYGDLGGYAYGYVQIPQGASCNTTSGNTGLDVNCFGENISSSTIFYFPSTGINQTYIPGTYSPIGFSPC